MTFFPVSRGRARVTRQTIPPLTTTAANLVNELVEARQQNAVKRVLTRWLRYDVIVLDEVGCLPLADIGAEILFQVIAERTERAALIMTTNLPFTEWTKVFPNPRLCKALLDRITDWALDTRPLIRVSSGVQPVWQIP